MNETISFLVKLTIISLILSLVIKYSGLLISIPPTDVNALIIVMILPLTVALLLGKKMLSKDSDS
ncbi:hypothetical protein CWATWH0402_5370 [Crocosphaera watsonii WH 0402]|uniref:Uncharacterized protein n=2 Tax=Crocosphaera watsonii TaxID=263511 RepID=T2JY21_CROWT|nr:hypothetical protein [Crocosphaera sp.]NQZ62385.1 hypothetical protein [Crocosphaera sp.]CCQ55620.1 hypothetical protein CWATWH0005_5699 [Crocosphaera watsonii WH 0005]CCQ70120.1 hypothetical protein CWATWH0402_5370 [Crocosphaera watsonii WH 0402]